MQTRSSRLFESLFRSIKRDLSPFRLAGLVRRGRVQALLSLMPSTRHWLNCCRPIATVVVVIGWSAAGEAAPLTGTVVFGTGYDQSAVILPQTLGIDSGVGGASADARAEVGWQAVHNAYGRLRVLANGGYRQVDGGTFAEEQAGGAVDASRTFGPAQMGVRINGDRRWLESTELAWNIGLSLGVTVPMDDQTARPELAVRVWHYDQQPDANAVAVTARYRHWLPLADGDSRQRGEIAVEMTRNQADSDSETFNELLLSVGVWGRIGPQRGSGRWDFASDCWGGLRKYHTGLREQRLLAGIAGSLDRWFDPWVALGLEARWEHLADQPDGQDYDGIRASLRATAAF